MRNFFRSTGPIIFVLTILLTISISYAAKQNKVIIVSLIDSDVVHHFKSNSDAVYSCYDEQKQYYDLLQKKQKQTGEVASAKNRPMINEHPDFVDPYQMNILLKKIEPNCPSITRTLTAAKRKRPHEATSSLLKSKKIAQKCVRVVNAFIHLCPTYISQINNK
ncbi:MAG: hypothetical protein HAW67_01240 [Endozoicomonadaceae bacterium]|nr:hypothetical protein [Endozoicomonadaceae bacterium]